jgi:hypothetical protein
MRVFIFLLLFSLPLDAYEIIGGGLVTHPFSEYDLFPDNSPSGFMYRSLYGVGFTTYETPRNYNTISVFGGKNSIQEPIYGALYGVGNMYGPNFGAGFVYGGYFQDENQFKKYNLTYFTLVPGFAPILGIELIPRLKLGKNIWLKMNNILTPLMTSHSLSLEIL